MSMIMYNTSQINIILRGRFSYLQCYQTTSDEQFAFETQVLSKKKFK